MARRRPTLQQQATQILAQADKLGVKQGFLFRTTFERYRTQLRILSELETAIDEYGMTVTKEYVKGRENLVSNPAITEYNRTATAANNTVASLIKILQSVSDDPDATDALTAFLKSDVRSDG